jgi:WD40 repeat protein
VCESLAQIGGPQALDTLIHLLHDPVGEVRGQAAAGLGGLGDPRAVQPLRELLEDQDGFVRRRAREALRQSGDRTAISPDDDLPISAELERGTSASQREAMESPEGRPPSMVGSFLLGGRVGRPAILAVVVVVAAAGGLYLTGLIGGVIRTSSTSPLPDNISGVAFFSAGDVVTLTQQGTVEFWGTSECRRLAELPRTDSTPYLMTVSPDERLMAFACDDRSLRVFKAATRREAAVLPGRPATVRGVQFNDDATRLVTVTADGFAELWYVADREKIRTIALGEKTFSAVAVSSDLQLIAVGRRDGLVTILDAKGRRSNAGNEAPRAAISCLAFRGDGKRLACGDEHGSVAVWDVQKREPAQKPEQIDAPVTAIAFSKSGRWLAAGRDGQVHLWNLSTRKSHVLRATLERGGSSSSLEQVDMLCFSADENLLAAASAANRDVVIWEVESRSIRCALPR